MIDEIYTILLTLLSKDNQGYVTPEEFNKISNLVQMEIFRKYFEQENDDKNKQNRGLSNEGYANLPFNLRQRIDQFAVSSTLTLSGGVYPLPSDIYFLEEDGISSMVNGSIVEEAQRKDLAYLAKSIASPTITYPVYERFSNNIKVYPLTITTSLNCRYIRTPSIPKWTYYILPNNQVKFDPTNPSYQDFELHPSEFSNIVVKMLSYFGITIREEEVIKVAESLKQQNNENSVQ